MPPKLSGREPALEKLKDLLGNLQEDNRPPPSEAVVYGPRGNGKTVLLTAFRQQCADVDVLNLRPFQIKNETMLATQLLYTDAEIQNIVDDKKPDIGGFNIKVIFAEWHKMSREDRDAYRRMYFSQLLAVRCAKKPLVVTLDEAHKLDTQVGCTLLDAVELTRTEGVPLLLVLSGTPNLLEHLREMNVSFFSRAEKIGIGRLDVTATREALVVPLKDNGIDFDADALETVIAESQYYPYFIQLWGAALCRALRGNETTRIDMAIVDAARPRFAYNRIDYYKDRHAELYKYNLLPHAIVVAEAFQDHDQEQLTDLFDLLTDRLSLDDQSAKSALKVLSDLGYIWEPAGSAHIEPGIPSLMSYVLDKSSSDNTDDRKSIPMPPADTSSPEP